jgi:transposase-like protein
MSCRSDRGGAWPGLALRWPAEEIVMQSFAGQTLIAAMARNHGIGTGRLYSWHYLLGRPHQSRRTCP